MAWRIDIAPAVKKELDKIGQPAAGRIVKYLHERIAPLSDPRSLGDALKGPKFGEYWRYRLGEYRIIAKIEDDALLILVLSVGHRKHVYK